MLTLQRIIPGCYRDSLSLMQLSAELSRMPGVSTASAIMATSDNIALLREAGMAEALVQAGPNDLLVVIHGEEAEALERAFATAVQQLNSPDRESLNTVEPSAPRSIQTSLDVMPCNLALISVPGEYAAAEALKALRLGLNVMLFSANVSEEDEVELKQYALAHDLIVMGPDCGTAIVNGIPLGFANVVRRGNIGCVGASGTGLQEVTTLIDRAGGGISQVIGTGGRDLSGAVGGISTLQGLQALSEDPETRVIVLVSKPPAPAVAARLEEAAAGVKKPVVMNFLGYDPGMRRGSEERSIFTAKTLEDSALRAMALSRGCPIEQIRANESRAGAMITREAAAFDRGQKYIRGLYSGGTLACEAVLLLNSIQDVGRIHHNTSISLEKHNVDVWDSREHTIVDLGDPSLTRGRPHPMIDPRLRQERILREARDPEVAVILLDVVLGYGAHMNPAGALSSVVAEAKSIAQQAGRRLCVVASVCGTASDPQDARRQEETLTQSGVIVAHSNADAVRIAAELVTRRS